MIARAVTEFTEGVVSDVATNVLDRLTASPSDGGTPVDTSFATRSWIATVGSPSVDVAGSRESVSSGPQEAGRTIIMGYRLSQGALFITNNAPYIMLLNFGSSPQAQPAFVDIAIARAVNETVAIYGGVS